MKKIILILLTTLSLSSCNKDDDTPINPVDQLPPATTTGANKAGCLVNGVAFLPKGSSQFGPILSCFYQQDIDGFHFGFSMNNKKNSSSYETVQFATNPLELAENTTYALVSKISNTNNTYVSNFGEYFIISFNGDLNYVTTGINTGELKITKLDTQQKIISGTFWYDAINSAGEKVEVREGRFDMRYVN
uniref:DUF6252 family protein n=1 Tax=Flavobacterium sp. TaxID=239 RepID=UPI00404AB0BB